MIGYMYSLLNKSQTHSYQTVGRHGQINQFAFEKYAPYQPNWKGRIKIFVSYAYSEDGSRKDSLNNLDFFLRHGASVPNDPTLTVDYGLTVNGGCTKPQCRSPGSFTFPNSRGETPHFQVLHRENEGFDFGAHTAILENLDKQMKTPNYDAFVFLNDGVTGPIAPSYMPHDWHWVIAFVERLRGGVGLVGTSIVCLPKEDKGGLGPKVEGFAFSLSSHALGIARSKGTSFQQHKTKVSTILDGEYNLTTVLLANGVKIDCLLKAYQGVDWTEKSQWSCNDQKNPSRSGSYFGTSFNPMEVLFHKSHWANEESVNEKVLDMYVKMADDAQTRRFEHSPPRKP